MVGCMLFCFCYGWFNYNAVVMGAMASQITSPTLVYSTVYSDADRRQHKSSALLDFVWGIHRGPVNSPHKGPVTRKMFPFDDVIMFTSGLLHWYWNSHVIDTVTPPLTKRLARIWTNKSHRDNSCKHNKTGATKHCSCSTGYTAALNLLYTHLHGKWDLWHHNPPDSCSNHMHKSANKPTGLFK